MEELQLKLVMVDEWGKCLKNKNLDIFDAVEKAIKVAVTDHPQEFMRRRDEIAHSLYWCEFSEEEKRIVGEVLRIKAYVADCMSESVINESLNKLHKMGLSFKVVDAADIGNTVSGLQYHASKKVKQIAEMIIDSWIRRAMFDRWVDPCEKTPAVFQEKEQSGDLKKNGSTFFPAENQNVQEMTKSLKVRIKVLKLGNKVTGEVLSSKGAFKKRSRDEFEASFNGDGKNTKINSEKARTPKGRVEQMVKLIHSNATMEEKLKAASRKLREVTKSSDKKRRVKILQSWEVDTPLPPESQMKSTRFRR